MRIHILIHLVLILSLTLLPGCESKKDKDKDKDIDVEPEPVSTLDIDMLKQAIKDIEAQSRPDYHKSLKQIASEPNKKEPALQDGEVTPPKGASAYKAMQDRDFIAVKSGLEQVSRNQGKAASQMSIKPEKPRDWQQLGYSTQSYSPKSGLDKRLIEATESIHDRKYSYAFILLNIYSNDQVIKELREKGVELLGPHASAYKVKVPLDVALLKAAADLPYVEWLGYALPEQKVDRNIQRAQKQFAEKLDTLPVIINFFDETAAKMHQSVLRKKGIILGQYDSDIGSYTAIVPGNLIGWLSEQDYVLFIELEIQESGSHDQSMSVMGVDYIRTGGGGTNFSGASTIVGILDTGFMVGGAAATTHFDLNKYGCGKNFTSDTAGVWNDQNDHGTHVLGTIAGTGTGDSRNRGVATGIGSSASTRIRAAKIWNSTGSSPSSSWMRSGMNFMDDNSACGSGKPKVVNISGGATGAAMSGTDSRSRKLDAKVWSHKQAYIVCSGNSGPGNRTIWAPGVAKNALTVGNVLDSGDQTVGDINNGSSRGSTGDGRMKPNLVATGTTITSADAGTSNGYRDMTGCSMATPHVTGIAATVLQHYSDFRDRPYLLRAHLMSTAVLHDDITTPANNNSGGRNTYGLGRVSSYISHWARTNSNGCSTHWGTRTITNSNWGYRDINIPSGTDRLVVVMTWDEPAASAGASDAVAYDLDLWVDRNADCSPDDKGQCGEWASQSWDDNVEYLIINSPAAGTDRLKIINWDAPRSGVPAALVATVIRGDPTPDMTLTTTASTTSPSVGSTVSITTTVSNPAYVASGVYLERSNLPAGLSFLGVSTTREDGVSMNFTTNNLSLGNIVQGDARTATWTFQINSAGTKTINFKAWSENGGTKIASVTINPA